MVRIGTMISNNITEIFLWKKNIVALSLQQSNKTIKPALKIISEDPFCPWHFPTQS